MRSAAGRPRGKMRRGRAETVPVPAEAWGIPAKAAGSRRRSHDGKGARRGRAEEKHDPNYALFRTPRGAKGEVGPACALSRSVQSSAFGGV